MTNEARRIDLGRVSPAAFSMLAAELMGAKRVSSVSGRPLPLLMPAYLRTLRLAVRWVLFLGLN